MIYRRRRTQYIFAGFLATVAIINVLFFFILNRPAQTEYRATQETIEQLQKQVGKSQQFYTKLEKTSTQLDRFDQDKRNLLLAHLVERGMGYSQILTQLDGIVQHSGVKKTRVTYTFDPASKAGLNALSIVLPLEGNYTNIVNFIRELENSDTFFLITAINVETASQPVAGAPASAAANSGSIGLSLALETYFYQ